MILWTLHQKKEIFFFPHHFYSILKDDVINREEYKNVNKFYQTMKLKDLGKLNKIYNFQDTVILCEIFEQWSEYLQRHFKNNPRKCNSASSFERSTLQLMSILERNEDKARINTFSYTSKTHSTLEEKNSFLSLLNIFIF